MLTTDEKTAVEKGREVIDAYRKAHAEFKPSEQSVAFGKLFNELNDLGLDKDKYPFYVFFEKSQLYNIESLGFDDKADFESSATEEDKETLKSMWK